MGKRKGLEEAWRGPQYTFRSDEPGGKEEKSKSSKEEKRISSFEKKGFYPVVHDSSTVHTDSYDC